MDQAAEPRRELPSSPEEAAEVLREASRAGHGVRIRGAGTKLSWGRPSDPPDIELSTKRLGEVLEHNEGDLTAVLQAGVPLAHAQEVLAGANQMIALDPPLGVGGDGFGGNGAGATIGGVVATADSGPLRHRYAAARDLILGITVALADGTVARAGGKVIKNVAGYDLAKLFTGSFGTLGVICEVVLRLHPRPRERVTVVGSSKDPDALGQATSAVAHSPYGPECLDISWRERRGEVLVRFGGAAPEAAAEEVMQLVEQAGLEAKVVSGDDRWDRQRAAQRSADGAVVKVSGLPAELPAVLRCAQEVGGSLVGRAGLGVSWMTVDHEDVSELVSAIEEVRRRLQPFPCVVLDAPGEVREKIDVWGEDAALPLMRRVKDRFDPGGVCNPGIFVGGL